MDSTGSINADVTTLAPPIARGRHGHCGRPLRCAEPPRTEVSDPAASRLSFSRQERTTLYIQTQEGDIVRLKIRTSDALAAQQSTREEGDTLLTELQLAARSTSRISFYVQGNLNADELAAIQSVVEQSGALANEFFAGDLAASFEAAAALDIDSTQLAKVGLRLRAREQFTYSAPVAPASTTAAPAAAEPVTSGPGASGSGAIESNATAAPALATRVLAEVADFVAHLLGSLSSPGLPPPVTADEGSMVTDQVPAATATAPATVPSLDLSLKIRIFHSVLMTASVSIAELPALVPDTLAVLAAQQQPPMAAVA